MLQPKRILVACLGFAILLPLVALGQAPPAAGHNNLWYYYSNSDTVLVFVHGILSDSRTCWLNTTSKPQVYWPALVRNDASRFGNVAIYLGGYYTAVDSGPYKIQNAAREIFDALQEVDTAGRQPVMAKKNLVFIGHSTGGIVIRYMLDAHRQEFADKTIGLVLVASPSIGSKQADRLAWLTEYFKNEMGRQLKWDSELLADLDDRFSMLIADKRLPYLAGIEACENHFVVHHRFLPDSDYVVSPESGARYFRPCKMLPNTDHFSAVKPDSKEHTSHRMLWTFYSTKFKSLVEARNRATVGQGRVAERVAPIRRAPVDVGYSKIEDLTVDLPPDAKVYSVEVFARELGASTWQQCFAGDQGFDCNLGWVRFPGHYDVTVQQGVQRVVWAFENRSINRDREARVVVHYRL